MWIAVNKMVLGSRADIREQMGEGGGRGINQQQATAVSNYCTGSPGNRTY